MLNSFHIDEASKRYHFRAEPPHIYRDFPPPPHPRVNIPVQYTGVYGVKEQSLNKSGKGQFIFLLSMTSYFVLITYGALQGAAGAIP